MSSMNMMKKRKASTVWVSSFEPRCVQICRKKIEKGKVDIVKVLPEELVEDILLRLPLKSIISSGCVCKSWYSLIRSRNFVSTHFHKTKINNNNNKSQVFLFEFESKTFGTQRQKQISFIFDTPSDPDHQLDYRAIRLPVGLDPYLSPSFGIFNSVNGIVCLYDYRCTSNFILCNPSIRHSLLVPVPEFMPFEVPFCSSGILGFGFDDINHDYIIIRILKINNHNHWTAQRYSLNLNCWRDILAPIPNFHVCIRRQRIVEAAFVNGRFHWVVKDADDKITNLIMVFDLKQEAFRQLPLPKSLSQVEHLKVQPFWESSIVLTQGQVEWVAGAPVGGQPLYWVMREYGDGGSWQSLTDDQLLESVFRCPHKDIKQEFSQSIKPSRHSLDTYMPSLELLDIQRLQY